MKAKFGIVIVEGHGKLGGNYISQGIHGAKLVTRRNKRKSRSMRQLLRLNQIAYIIKMWRTLTDTQRKSWRMLTINNTSGFQLFLRHNFPLYMIVQPLVLEAPRRFRGYPFVTWLVQWIPPAQQFVLFMSMTIPFDYAIMVYASRPLPKSINYLTNDYKYLLRLPDGTTSPRIIKVEYNAVYGGGMSSFKRAIFKLVAIQVSTGYRTELGYKFNI